MSNVVKWHEELDGPRPGCFTEAQWANWVAREKAMSRSGRYVADPNGFCSGCTKRYSERMIGEGKCRHPDVTFCVDEDGDLVAVRPGCVPA